MSWKLRYAGCGLAEICRRDERALETSHDRLTIFTTDGRSSILIRPDWWPSRTGQKIPLRAMVGLRRCGSATGRRPRAPSRAYLGTFVIQQGSCS